MSSAVRRKTKGTSTSGAGSGGGDYAQKVDNSDNGITDAKKLTSALQQIKLDALASGMTSEEFQKCAVSAAKRLKLRPLDTKAHGRSRLITTLKVLWLIFLMLLAIALLSAAVKPIMFYMHKVSVCVSQHGMGSEEWRINGELGQAVKGSRSVFFVLEFGLE